MERSVEMVVGVLGILKAGGAYVPLDPRHSREELASILDEAEVRVILTGQGLDERLPEGKALVARLDAQWDEIAGEDATRLGSPVTAENAACIDYVSAPTGGGVGVVSTHAGICNALHWARETGRLMESDRVLQNHPHSRGAATWELFRTLSTGARMLIAKPEERSDVARLRSVIEARRPTALHCAPALLAALMRDSDLESSHWLKKVTCSGGALSGELQTRFFATFDAELDYLYNADGNVAPALFSSCQRESGRRFAPAGRPIANTRAYILDGALQALPVGIAGELCIGGEGLARGFLNRPELTAEHFTPDPFAKRAGARLYRTGEFARHVADGAIELLGRADDLVKVRGFHINVERVEIVLREHAGVREAAVVLREDAKGVERLAAYVAGHGISPTPGELRDYMRECLPDYAIPFAFIVLDALPLTPDGDVDRRALPTTLPDDSAAPTAYVAAGTLLEELVTGVWCEVLGVERVGVHDNFFDLGGRSMLVVQAHGKLQRMLEREIPLIDLFKYTTVRALVDYLNSGGAGESLIEQGTERAETRKSSMRRRRNLRHQR